MIMSVINTISGFLWGWPLITLLIVGGIYFSVRTQFVQFGMFKEAWRVILEKPENEGDISSFGALMVSTASRVGTGNIIGVFGPRLNKKGNSVGGEAILKVLSDDFLLHTFAGVPNKLTGKS